ncbi:VOC family protein [Cellulomonas sp. ICMP 17802]|uniref:VOC family protein n=1 Tax=Cellulomonas sp. ICMP 17802 TaxID=3239199 RepID=UPI00351AE213
MPSRLTALTIDASDPARLARFWADLLGRDAVADASGVLVPATAAQLGLRFVPSAAPRVGLNPSHLHLTSAVQADQDDTVARALRLGAGHLDVGQLPGERHVVLADPEGNAFCVIEPGNRFLAGCGFLGELTCEGGRETGVFWSRALGWPLVWDQDDETAVQSPQGGTKVSWDGKHLSRRQGRDRLRLELGAVGDLRAEVDRLVALGATRLGATGDGSVALVDPGGNELSVRGAP